MYPVVMNTEYFGKSPVVGFSRYAVDNSTPHMAKIIAFLGFLLGYLRAQNNNTCGVIHSAERNMSSGLNIAAISFDLL